MKVLVLLAAMCGTLLGSPQLQSPTSNIGSNSGSSSRSSKVIAGKVAGHLSIIYDLLGESAKDLPSCSFPFTYKGVKYHKCTTDHDSYGMFWCSTNTDDQGNHAYSEWRHCVLSDGLLSFDASVAAEKILGSNQKKTYGGAESITDEERNYRDAFREALDAVPVCPIEAVPFEEQCLTFSAENDKRSWRDAAEACMERGGRLATLRYPEAVRDYVAENISSTSFWTGASDIRTANYWIWTDGEPLDEQFPWDGGKPSNEPGKDCQVVHDRKYSAVDCTSTARYTCEMVKLFGCHKNKTCHYVDDGHYGPHALCCSGVCRKQCGSKGDYYCPTNLGSCSKRD